MDSSWTSLEIAKLAVSALTPILVVGLGVLVARVGRRIEDAQWASRKLVERRIDLYDEMAPLLNDLYCVFGLVGHFREIPPPEAIGVKRRLDRAFYVNRYLMSEEFGLRYHAFINSCFEHYTGIAAQAKLRAPLEHQRAEWGGGWRDEWRRLYVDAPEDVTPWPDLQEGYAALMDEFSRQVGVRAATPA